MSVTPQEILNTATLLASESSSGEAPCEANVRSSISRAYYAALHAADQALPSDLSPTDAERKSQSSHQAVIDATSRWARALRPGRMEAVNVARNLSKLRAARKRADYALHIDMELNDASSALRTATSTLLSAARAAGQATELTA
jgi:uncharacterized protein (UPF0332 family)